MCGIANPKPLQEILTTYSASYEILFFKDHHIFTIDDLQEIKNQFSSIESENKIILTTEKDGVRLAKYESELRQLPIFAIPMRHKFLFGDDLEFENTVVKFVETYQETKS